MVPLVTDELRHVGTPCRLLPNGTVEFPDDVDAPSKEGFAEMMRREFQIEEGLGPPDPIADHAPIRYSRALARRLTAGG